MALVLAMLVTVLATVMTVAMVERMAYALHYTANVTHDAQAMAYLAAVERWAGTLLARDRRETKVDHLREPWATVVPPMAIDGGVLSARVEDMQGRFNLNNLVDDGRISAPDVERFRRLLGLLDLPVSVSDAVVDWLDDDMILTYPDGAEDGAYLGLQPAYRAANRRFYGVSELRLIKGMNREVYDRLRPHVCALPVRTLLNVNTAIPVVLRSHIDGLTEAGAERLINDRGESGYPDVETFARHEIVAGRVAEAHGMSVGSDYFSIAARVVVGRSEIEMTSLIDRHAQGPAVIFRSRAGL